MGCDAWRVKVRAGSSRDSLPLATHRVLQRRCCCDVFRVTQSCARGNNSLLLRLPVRRCVVSDAQLQIYYEMKFIRQLRDLECDKLLEVK